MDNELIQILESMKNNLTKIIETDDLTFIEDLQSNNDLINSCQKVITNELEN